MTDLVLDASVATQLLFPEQYSHQSLALIESTVEADGDIIGPPLLPVEMVNVIRKRMRSDGLTLAQARAVLDTFVAYAVTLVNPPGLHHQALALTEAHSLGGYDAHYVALAQMLGFDLWTADQRMLRAVGSQLPFVRWIGDYATPAGR